MREKTKLLSTGPLESPKSRKHMNMEYNTRLSLCIDSVLSVLVLFDPMLRCLTAAVTRVQLS